MPSPPDLPDADALRVLSDQLEEHGLDAGAALLRDVAGRMDRSIEVIDWPEGVYKVRSMRYRGEFLLIEAEKIGDPAEARP